MVAIVIERTIAATPQRVWSALTQQDQISCWWTEEARVRPEVGSLGEFYFRPPAGVLKFEVTELKPDELVRWAARSGPPSWMGTTVTWQLTSAPDGTKVAFTQDGFTRTDEGYQQTQRNWDYFLNSLKSYLETGKGNPGFPVSV